MGVAAIWIGAGVHTSNASEQHVHACRKQHRPFAVSSDRRDGEQHAHRLQRVVFWLTSKDTGRQLVEGAGLSPALLHELGKRLVIDEIVVHPFSRSLCGLKGRTRTVHAVPKIVQCVQTGCVILELLGRNR